MKQFLKKYINDKYKNNLIIMYNGGSHKRKEIGKNIEKLVIYYNSVPYRPRTNTLENYFNEWVDPALTLRVDPLFVYLSTIS